MNKVKKKDEMRSEYKIEDLGVGVRGKYYEAYKESHNILTTKPARCGDGGKTIPHPRSAGRVSFGASSFCKKIKTDARIPYFQIFRVLRSVIECSRFVVLSLMFCILLQNLDSTIHGETKTSKP